MHEFKIFAPFLDRIEYGVSPDLFGILADQVHGDLILEVSAKPETIPLCDGFMTNKAGLSLMVKVADCQGILMYDPITHSAAAVHSGWRGSTLNIIGRAVEKMREAYGTNPADLLVAISPSLGPCCAVFTDPKNELPESCYAFIREGNLVDFWALSVSQLLEAGVRQIEVAGKCTKCQPGYFSHRNGDSGRMGVFVTLL